MFILFFRFPLTVFFFLLSSFSVINASGVRSHNSYLFSLTHKFKFSVPLGVLGTSLLGDSGETKVSSLTLALRFSFPCFPFILLDLSFGLFWSCSASLASVSSTSSSFTPPLLGLPFLILTFFFFFNFFLKEFSYNNSTQCKSTSTVSQI